MISDPDQALSQLPLFSGFTLAEIAEIRAAGRLARQPAGSFYFMQGDPADALYVLAEGRIRLGQVTPDGQQVLLRVVVPYSPFGIIALVQGESYPVSAEAAEPSAAYCWSKNAIAALTARHPRLVVNGMKMMAANLQEFQERFRELATQRVERRLARMLLRLGSQTGKKTPEGVLIDLPLSRQDLAEMTGTTLYTVSRILSQWETQGLVHSGRARVVIRDPHGLVMVSEEE